MLIPEIKNYYVIAPEHIDIDEWIPEDPAHVDFWLRLCIGEPGKDGADFYDVHVVTQKQMSQVDKSNHIHIIPLYSSAQNLITELQTKVGNCRDISWIGAQEQLRQLFHWEYEGMSK